MSTAFVEYMPDIGVSTKQVLHCLLETLSHLISYIATAVRPSADRSILLTKTAFKSQTPPGMMNRSQEPRPTHPARPFDNFELSLS